MFAFLFLMLQLTAPPLAPQKRPLAQIGQLKLQAEGLLLALEEAQLQEQLRSGSKPPRAGLLKKGLWPEILLQILQRRLLREECEQRGLFMPTEFLERALLKLSGEQSLTAEALEAQLVARFESELEQLKKALSDSWCRQALKQHLADEVSEAEIKSAWRAEKSQLRLEIFQISRVPSSREIDLQLKREPEALRAYYDNHPKLFYTPERLHFEFSMLPQALSFEALSPLMGFLTEAAQGGRPLTRSSASLPELSKLPLGGWYARWDPSGLKLFHLKARYPAMERLLKDIRVQREIAASLLRERDQLPQARGWAEELRAELKAGREISTALIQRARIRSHQTPDFSERGPLIPGLGLAPELKKQAFEELSLSAPISKIHKIRQHYVIAKLLERHLPEEGAWVQEGEAFQQRWRLQNRGRLLSSWLRAQGEIFMDHQRIEALIRRWARAEPQ